MTKLRALVSEEDTVQKLFNILCVFLPFNGETSRTDIHMLHMYMICYIQMNNSIFQDVSIFLIFASEAE